MNNPDDADEAWVEDEGHPHGTFRQEPVSQLEGLVMVAKSYFSNPWVLLLVAIFTYMVYKKGLHSTVLAWRQTYAQWVRRRKEAQEVAAQKKDPDLYRQKMEAMERARRKQQEEYDQAAKAFAEKQRLLEEKKRQDKLGLLPKDKVKDKDSSNKAATLKSDNYSPLMSSGPSCSYRPDRRGLSGGG